MFPMMYDSDRMMRFGAKITLAKQESKASSFALQKKYRKLQLVQKNHFEKTG